MRWAFIFCTACCNLANQNFAATTDLELKRILKEDNAAITEITGWINQNLDQIRSNTTEQESLALRINDRLNIVRKQYLNFLKKHPKHTNARIAYGSFLTHIDNRKGAVDQWKLALAEDPKNAAALNNLATHLGTIALQTGISEGMKEAFKAMDKALEIAPSEPLYHHNQATLLCSFTEIAATHYRVKPQQIIQKALAEYDSAIQLEPKNFEFAADRAEALLDLKPFPYQNTLIAWSNALKLATKQDERDWVHLQRAMAHYKANRWKNVSRALGEMSGQFHQSLSMQLRKAAQNKSQLENPKP